jgi:hypothetical protein
VGGRPRFLLRGVDVDREVAIPSPDSVVAVRSRCEMIGSMKAPGMCGAVVEAIVRKCWALLFVTLVFATSGCGSSKLPKHPDGSDANLQDLGSDEADLAPSSDVTDVSDIAESSTAADMSDAADAGHAADASDATDASGHCIGEGKETLYPMGTDCCSGLRSIPVGSGPMGPPGSGESQPNCSSGLDSWVCSRCGNGVCEDWERPCGCPEDCGPVCGDKKCPVGTYCRRQAPGPDGGTSSFQCIDVVTDCDGGIFYGGCASVRNCGCIYDRWICNCVGP